MSITIANYVFEGPYSSINSVQDRSGIYVILDDFQGGYHVLDVGESAGVKTRLASHDRSAAWQMTAQGRIVFAVLYTQMLHQQGRIEIEAVIRQVYKPPCGIR